MDLFETIEFMRFSWIIQSSSFTDFDYIKCDKISWIKEGFIYGDWPFVCNPNSRNSASKSIFLMLQWVLFNSLKEESPPISSSKQASFNFCCGKQQIPVSKFLKRKSTYRAKEAKENTFFEDMGSVSKAVKNNSYQIVIPITKRDCWGLLCDRTENVLS